MIKKINNLSPWHKDKLIKKVILISLSIVFIFIIGASFWLFRNHNFMSVIDIQVTGTRMVPANKIIDLMMSEAVRHSGFIDFVLPDNHRFAYKNNEEIIRIIKSHFPRIKDISILWNHRERMLLITVSERIEKIIWCDNEDKCLWLDDDGFALSSAPSVRGTMVSLISDEVSRGIKEGSMIIDRGKLQNLIQGIEMIKNFNWAIQEISITDSLRRSATIRIISGQEIFISLEHNSRVAGVPVIETIISDGKWPRIQYIDLRIDGRGFYKLR